MSKSARNSVYTLTFGDVAENHVGMEKIGKMVERGFEVKELEEIKKVFEEKGTKCELLRLEIDAKESELKHEEAAVLVIRGGINAMGSSNVNFANILIEEQRKLEYDRKYKAYGKVKNKHARWNICFNEEGHPADYENGKGTVISFKDVPELNKLRNMLYTFCGEKAKELKAEGNYYYDTKKCYIGWHGDAERRVVIGVRLGDNFPLFYQWYYKGKTVGPRYELMLGHGDIYIMSHKASGFDWKKRNIPTLRHAAGFNV